VVCLVTSCAKRAYEPLYEIDPHTGVAIEIFYADRVLAASFGMGGAGWYFWSSWPGCRPGRPTGPFGTSYAAYRGALPMTHRVQSSSERLRSKRLGHSAGPDGVEDISRDAPVLPQSHIELSRQMLADILVN
jgi:hypothetical protein